MRAYALVRVMFDEPFAVASPEAGSQDVDLPVATTPEGEVHVPGTSIAGALRSHVAKLAGSDVAAEWFGPLTDWTRSASDPGEPGGLAASPVWVLGTDVTWDDRPLRLADVWMSTHTAIDRTRGAAKERTLRRREMCPAGTELVIYLRIDGQDPKTFVDLLSSWNPYVGGGKSRGSGKGRVESIAWGQVDPTTTEGVRLLASLHGPALVREIANQVVDPNRSKPEQPLFDVEFAVGGGGVAVHSGTEGNRKVLLLEGGEPFIPGSTLKGVFRSRAEFILRSIGVEVCTPFQPCEPLDTTRPCAICRLFGSPSTRGALRFAAAPISDPVVETQNHVAIDRVTGGAAPGRLYSSDVITSGKFKVLIERIPYAHDSEVQLSQILVPWILHDMKDGLVGVGAETGRGLGSISPLDLRDAPEPLRHEDFE